jgi:T5SS/PEP-CTERM-associated repeat protein
MNLSQNFLSLPSRGSFRLSRHVLSAVAFSLGGLVTGGAQAAIYNYTNGQNNTSTITVSESSVFGISSGTAVQSGPVVVNNSIYGSSKAGDGTLVFSGYLGFANFLMAEGKVVVTGASGSMQNLTVGALSDEPAPIFEVNGGSLTVSGYYVGATQAGELRVTNGGKLYDQLSSSVGAGNTGALTISGTGSAVISSGYQLTVGGSGTGSVVLTDGGRLSSNSGSRVVVLGDSSSGRGTLNIGARSGEAAAAPGVVDLNQIIGGDGGGVVVFNHTSTNYYLSMNGAENGALMWVHGDISFRVESGVTTIRDINTNTGETVVVGGELVIALVDAPYSALGSGAVSVGVSGTLSGGGLVLGDTTIAGALSPGKNSIDLMSFENGLTLESTATLSIEIGGYARGLQYDAIDVAGMLDLDGTLRISFVNGFIPTEGDTFAIFGGGFASNSNFANVILPSGYQGIFDAVTGELSITPIPEPSSVLLVLLAGGLVCGRRRRGVRIED